MIVPEKGIDFRVYDSEGDDLVGVAEGTFPDLEAKTETVSGAGIAGDVDSLILGHLQSMTLALTWRNVTDGVVKLAQQKTHNLDLYAAQQDYDSAEGVYKVRSVHVFVKVNPKKIGLGKLASASMTDTTSEFEVLYMKLLIDDKERLEVDKYNYIFKVDGVDYLEEVRRALGKE